MATPWAEAGAQRRWPQLIAPLGVLAVLTLCMACSADGGVTAATPASQTERAQPAAAATPAAAGTAVPAATAAYYDDSTLERRPLAALSETAAAQAALIGVSVAVIVHAEGVIYELNGDAPHPMYSTAKLPIMLTILQQTIDESRSLTEFELALIGAMITVSDNPSTDALWEQVGGPSAVAEYLRSIGVTLGVDAAGDWGQSRISAIDAARIVRMLVEGEILDGPTREVALNALTSVASYQSWGVRAGAPEGANTGQKNGWFLEPAGWQLNSVGFVLPPEGGGYTIAMLSPGWPGFYSGMSFLDALGTIIHGALAE
jgi:beta-lactamase class A